MTAPYSGPMIVKAVLDNDRYVVCDMPDSNRTRSQKTYENVISVDQMKPWISPGGLSDDTASESGSDGVPMSEDDEEQEEGDSGRV